MATITITIDTKNEDDLKDALSLIVGLIEGKKIGVNSCLTDMIEMDTHPIQVNVEQLPKRRGRPPKTDDARKKKLDPLRIGPEKSTRSYNSGTTARV